MEHKIGLVLSGGGVKGVAHIGALKALGEHGIFPSCIAGASAGAMVGALYASGKKPEEIFEIFKQSSLFSLSNFAIGKPGLIDLEKFKPYLQKHLPGDTFEALKHKLYVSATDLVRGRNKIFQSGPLVDTILASSAFPLVFSPYKVGEGLYADGGIVNNFPVEPLIDECDYIIGIYVNPLKNTEAAQLSNSIRVMERVYQITTRYSSLLKFEDCNRIILPQELEQYGTFDMKKAQAIFELGYEVTKKNIKVILDDLEQLT